MPIPIDPLGLNPTVLGSVDAFDPELYKGSTLDPRQVQTNKEMDNAETNEFGPGMPANNVLDWLKNPQVMPASGTDKATSLMIDALRQRDARAQMPFPDNRNPDTDFVNRWPNLPPSGIMNDLKPNMDPGLPMVRRLDMTNRPFPYE